MWQSPRLGLASLKLSKQHRNLESFSDWTTGLAIRSCFTLTCKVYHSFLKAVNLWCMLSLCQYFWPRGFLLELEQCLVRRLYQCSPPPASSATTLETEPLYKRQEKSLCCRHRYTLVPWIMPIETRVSPGNNSPVIYYCHVEDEKRYEHVFQTESQRNGRSSSSMTFVPF